MRDSEIAAKCEGARVVLLLKEINGGMVYREGRGVKNYEIKKHEGSIGKNGCLLC